jgi:hypothetical protein
MSRVFVPTQRIAYTSAISWAYTVMGWVMFQSTGLFQTIFSMGSGGSSAQVDSKRVCRSECHGEYGP